MGGWRPHLTMLAHQLALLLDELVEFVFVGLKNKGINHHEIVGLVHTMVVGHHHKIHAVLREGELLGQEFDLGG